MEIYKKLAEKHFGKIKRIIFEGERYPTERFYHNRAHYGKYEMESGKIITVSGYEYSGFNFYEE